MTGVTQDRRDPLHLGRSHREAGSVYREEEDPEAGPHAATINRQNPSNPRQMKRRWIDYIKAIEALLGIVDKYVN